MTNNLCTYLLYFLFFVSVEVSAQTAGLSDVISVEAKAATIDKNRELINQFREELINLEALWRNKLDKLKDELSALYKERDNLIADMKVGAKCSQCGKYKSEFEKEGKSFEQHLGEVKGYAVPATTAELEATRKMFSEKIALKKVQIQNLEVGDNAVLKKRKEISNLEETNDKLCKEITGLSKNYETKVFAEANAKQENWITELMNNVVSILIADDYIAVYKARIVRLNQAFQKETDIIKEQVRKMNLQAQNDRNTTIVTNQQRIEEIRTAQAGFLAPVESNLADLKKQKNLTEAELKKVPLTDSLKSFLTNRLNQLIGQIYSLEKTKQDYNTTVYKNIAALENENKRLTEEVFQLKANLFKQQEQEIARIKPDYDKKIMVANQGIAKSTTDLAEAKKLYGSKSELYKKQNQLYIDQVVTESNRIAGAGKKVNCSVWNDVRFKVMTNWNQMFPCVSTLATMAKPYSYTVFNSYCSGKSASSFKSSYKSFLLGLNAEDLETVRENSNVYWFEFIMKN